MLKTVLKIVVLSLIGLSEFAVLISAVYYILLR